jgi:hypothetical protein
MKPLFAVAALLLLGCSDPVAPDPDAFGARYLIQSDPDPPDASGRPWK